MSPRVRTVSGLAAVAVLAASACAGAPETASLAPGELAATCAPVETPSSEPLTLADRAGAYRVALVRSGAERASAEGRLTLAARPSDAPLLSGADTPLAGATDVDLRSVGATAAGDPASEDPAAPGVLVVETVEAGRPAVLLRIGSSVNRTEEVPIDEAYTVLRVQRVDAGGFAGTWRSGLMGNEVRGHFCAVAESG